MVFNQWQTPKATGDAFCLHKDAKKPGSFLHMIRESSILFILNELVSTKEKRKKQNESEMIMKKDGVRKIEKHAEWQSWRNYRLLH